MTVAMNLQVIEKEVNRHEQQIAEIGHKLNELTASHQEEGFLLKTYTENMKMFSDKIDKLTGIVEGLIPGRKEWDFEKRLELIEQKQQDIQKYKYPILVIISIVIIAAIAPEAIPPLLEALNQKALNPTIIN